MPLGWLISVYRQQSGGMSLASLGARPGDRLAVWQTGLGGLRWIDELVKEEKAVALGGNGHPLEYTAVAAHVVPRLRGDPPEAKASWTFDQGDILLPNWLGKTTKDVAVMDACRPDEWLWIEAWDES